MAVIDDLGISVAVRIGGTAAVEYADPDPSPDEKYPTAPVVSKYIESEPDKEYDIEFKTLPTHRWLPTTDHKNLLSFQAHTDGKCRAKMIYRASAHYARLALTIDGVRQRQPGASQETLQKFRFGAVRTNEIENTEVLNRDKKRAAGLGIIRVEVFRARDMGQTTAPAGNPKHNDMSIAEKALKGRAISHGTGFSDRTFLPVQEWVRADNLDKNPYVIFQFKYRSKEDLRNEMIVPRTPSPGPAAEGVDGLSQAELRRPAEERLAQIKEEKKPVIKREFGEVYDLTNYQQDKKHVIEREVGEVYDLTDYQQEKKPVIKREFGEVYDLTSEGSARTKRRCGAPETVDLSDD